MSLPINAPNKAGYYWAREKNFGWWNLIVRVTGEPPFLDASTIWSIAKDQLRTGLYNIHEFGPEIEVPLDPKVKKEEKPSW